MYKKYWISAACCVLSACGGGGSDESAMQPVTPTPSPNAAGFLYVANSVSSDVSAFTINSSTGALTAVTGSPFASSAAGSMAADPSGKFLFLGEVRTASSSNAAKLAGFKIDSASGALTSVTNSPYEFPGSSNSSLFISALQFHPSGGFLYWKDVASGVTYSHSVSATTGELTNALLQSGSPYFISASQGGVYDSSGQHFYAAALDGNSVVIEAYSVNVATGVRTFVGSQTTGQVISGSVLVTGTITINSTRDVLYLAEPISRSVAGYRINVSTGALTAIPGSPFAMGNGGNGLSFSTTFSNSGNFLYVLDAGFTLTPTPANGPAYLYGFEVDSTTGALTAVPGSPYPTGGVNASGMSVYGNDGHLIVMNGAPQLPCNLQCLPSIAIFDVDSSTGALTPKSGSPISTSQSGAGSFVLDPSSKFAYLTDSGASTITAYSISATTGMISTVGNYPIGTGSSPMPIIVAK